MWGLECQRDFLSVPALSPVFSKTFMSLTVRASLPPHFPLLSNILLLIVTWCCTGPVHPGLRDGSFSTFLSLPRMIAKLFFVSEEGFASDFSPDFFCPSPNSNKPLLCKSVGYWVQADFLSLHHSLQLLLCIVCFESLECGPCFVPECHKSISFRSSVLFDPSFSSEHLEIAFRQQLQWVKSGHGLLNRSFANGLKRL